MPGETAKPILPHPRSAQYARTSRKQFLISQEILQDFPYLTKEDILACLGFAAARERVMVKT
jgi:hypothetical protein